MAEETKYGKYVIREPRVECVDYHPETGVTGVTFPDEVWIDDKIIPNSPVVVDIGWRFEIPNPDPVEWTHSHKFDEVLMFVGCDPENPRDLGGEIEFTIGDEVHKFNKTTVVWMPKGTPHCPIIHKKVDKPFLLIIVGLAGHYPVSGEGE